MTEKASDIHIESKGKETIVLEDDQATQKVITYFLQNEEYQVVAAGAGIDALMKMGRSRFDLILSDINIPNLDGLKLLDMVQQKGLGTTIIWMSGRASPQDGIRGLDSGSSTTSGSPFRKNNSFSGPGELFKMFPGQR